MIMSWSPPCNQTALRIANEAYLRAHPELPRMMAACIEHIIRDRPADVLAATRDFFVSDAAAEAAASAL